MNSIANPPAMAAPATDRTVRRYLSAIELLTCVLLAGLLLWKGIVPGWQTLRTDFPNYYLVARLLREGYSLDRIYDWVWLQRIKDHWGIDQPLVGFAGLTPFSALPILPFAFFAALTAKRLWIVVNVLLLCATVEGLHKVTTLGRTRVLLLTLLCVFPLRTGFLLGQMHLLVLALLVCAYCCQRKNNRAGCALCLSLAGMLKVYPFVFGLYFLLRRQWATAAAMVVTTVALLGLSMAVCGPAITHTWLFEVLPRSLTGEVLDPYSAQSGSMAALMHRLFLYEPQLNPAPWSNSPALYTLLYPGWQVLILTPLLGLTAQFGTGNNEEQLHWAAWAFTLLLLSPVPASYHFVVMLFSMTLLANVLLTRRHYRTAGLALALYCLMSAVEVVPHRTVPDFARLWISTGFWMLLLWCLWRSLERPIRASEWQPQAALLGMVAIGLWLIGVSNYRRHFEHLSVEMQNRLPVRPQAYLATGLRNTAGGYVYTAMRGEGYQLMDQAGGVGHRPLADELSVATTGSSPDPLLEVSDSGGSRLVVLPARVVVDDGESPALSFDGQTVFFLRETRGRGTLWLARLRAPLGALQSAPVPLTSEAYDVRHFAAAPSGGVLFAAKLGSHTLLFQVMPGHSPQRFLSDVTDVDYPAISADEQRVAYTRNIDHRWQLEYVDQTTGARHTLTGADCNAYSPQWTSNALLAYATDCGRGLGLTALASVTVR